MAHLPRNTPLALPNDLYQELGESIRGPVYLRGDLNFSHHSTIFNGNVKSVSKAVACPLDAQDVSKIVSFCTKHSLYPSVKAGGYGTAGWAIGGDIIIDLSTLLDIDIEPPQEGGSFTSLRDMPSANGKGKAALTSAKGSILDSGKRRRADHDELRRYDSASRATASFLRDTPEDVPSPSGRRRMNPELSCSSGPNSEKDTSNQSHARPPDLDPEFNGSRNEPPSASPPPPTHAGPADTTPNTVRGADPFGYLNSSHKFSSPPSIVQSTFNPNLMYSPWGPGTSAILSNNPNLPITPVAPAEPIHAHAYVTFGAGMMQKEIDTYTATHPLKDSSLKGTIPYHVPFAAHPVGSSIMLLGGFGFLGRLHGLSIDNLVEVEMVLSDGRIVIVNNNDHPDLWWALRGAGPAFGIATRYKARAFPIPVVFAGNLIYRFHRATAPSLIKHFRDCVKGAPRELYANVLLTAGPAGKDSLVVVQMCYVGPKEKGQEYLAAISSWDGERCLLNEVDEKSFLHQQDSVAQVLRGKAGRQWFIRSTLISSLPDDVINETVIQFAGTPTGCTWLFELTGGAIADFEDTCFPKSQREAAFTIAALHQWEMTVHDLACVASAEKWISETLAPVRLGGPYPSFLGRHESAERTVACFGSNWTRLCEIKRLYDPTNLFKYTFWPLDAKGDLVDPQSHEPPTP